MELPIKGEKWVLNGFEVIVTAVQKRGRGNGHRISWETEGGSVGGHEKWSVWKKKAKAA